MELSPYDSTGKRKYLNAAENRRFLNAMRAMLPADKDLCRTLYFTGCRVSEALSLGPANFDSEENMLRIRTLKKRQKEFVRRIPIPSDLSASLQFMGSGQDQFWKFSRTTAWRIVKSAMLLAEIRGIQACPKGLRHGFGVRAAVAGIPVTVIKDWMGHSSVETTAIYLSVRDAEERELMARTWENHA